MIAKTIIAATAMLTLAGVAQAQVGTTAPAGTTGPIGSPTTGPIGSPTTGAITSPSAGDRARTGRDAIGSTPGTTSTTTGTVNGPTVNSPTTLGSPPPISGTGVAGEGSTTTTPGAVPPR